MTKTKENESPFALKGKQKKLVIQSCELLDNKAQLSSEWNRIIKPELILLFEDHSKYSAVNHTLTGLGCVKNKTHYAIHKNVKEYNMFDSENFKKQYPDLFKKFSKKNIRTNWTYTIKEV